MPQASDTRAAEITAGAPASDMSARVTYGWLINTYPSPSHTFIRREIGALERQGATVHRFAMRSDRGRLVDPADIAEDRATEHVLEAGATRLLSVLAARALQRPAAFAAALRLALQCGARTEGGARLRHLVYLAEAAFVARRCETLRISHLHAHFGTNSTTVALLVHALGGPGFSFTVHGPEEFDHPHALALDTKLVRARFAVAISQFGRSQLCRWVDSAHWSRLHVVHCGIEPARFADPPPMPPTPPLRLVAIGRLAEQKGLAILIDAMARALPDCPGLHLTLVGDGPLRPALESAIDAHGLRGHVTLTGWLDEAGVRAALGDAHVMVVPSFAEGLPVVVMEAMATARPVISTWVAGIPELVIDGHTGLLVPPGNATALATAITQMARTQTAQLAEMGQAGRARVLARHDADQSAKRLLSLLEQTAGTE